jgi:hypothetical protein
MARFIGRVALLATLAAAVCATFAVAAGARTTDAEGAGRTPGVRTPAAVLALNETETGTAEFVGGGTNCGFVSLDPTSTSVAGSPISDGEFESIHFFDCSTSGPCYSMAAIVLLADSRGEIEKFESGRMCVAEGTSTVTFRFNGTYEIIGGAGAYTNAQGTGAATRTWVCTDPSSCTVSGRESATQEEGPIKKGDDPAHVLLCSPTLVQRADGTMGNALQVPWADYQAWLSDPSSHPEIPTGSIPAKYGDGIGLTCDNLPGYEDSGTKVDEQGLAPSETNGALEGAIYPYWVKA